jgi:uncharacterized protein (TIGR01732 family)
VLISFLVYVCPIPFPPSGIPYIEKSIYLGPKEEVSVMGWGICGGCGYSAPVTTGGFGNNFALIVVLFILLIIVGAVICSGF